MSAKVKGLSTHEVVISLSQLSKDAFVHMYYDNIDNRNHKSLDSLVHVLEDSGFGQFAQIIHDQQPYVEFTNPEDAVKVYQFVNDHSAAINATLVYKGLENKVAEEQVKKDFPKEKPSHLIHTLKHN